ncbi:MAG: hypothetical protein CMN30_10330 [Sandaracinus sp.]|nr:hypothetical protein [Sandaracinus sp.]
MTGEETSVEERRSGAAAAVAETASAAKQAGRANRAAELYEVAMYLDPTSDRIRAWAEAESSVGSEAHREAMKELASWF